jgi:hypothetical protein
MTLLDLGVWVPILDGEPTAAAMYERHYSAAKRLDARQAAGTMLFMGPGDKLVLATPCRRGLFGWRRAQFRADGQTGVECSVFRNEGVAGVASSDLIRAADAIADERWPGLRHFTYVDGAATASRRGRASSPGECFVQAGWRLLDRVSQQRGLHILERAA